MIQYRKSDLNPFAFRIVAHVLSRLFHIYRGSLYDIDRELRKFDFLFLFKSMFFQ